MRYLEELQMNALPALQTVLYDGWVIRFADGYSNRANSVNPIYPSFEDEYEKIFKCEEIFRSRKLKPTYKITPFVYPENLDELLEGRGYRIIHPTSIQTTELHEEYPEAGPDDYLIKNVPELEDEWYEAFCRLNHVSPEGCITHRKMLDNLIPARVYTSLSMGGRIIACGMAVVEKGYIGFYDIVVDEQLRNKRCGYKLMLSIVKAGKALGARHAYLQVMLDNFPALNLYKKLGFKEIYRYHYRTLE